MRAFASSFHAWKSLERQEGIRVPHGLTFPLAVVAAIGAPHGLELYAEEHTPDGPRGFDAIFCSVLDSRCMVDAAKHFARWRVPFRREHRDDSWPLVVAGGQGLHNPMPFFDVADVIVIGDAEDPLPKILREWDEGRTRADFLERVSCIEGVIVPSIHDPARDTIVQAVASDISITLRSDIRVSHDGSRRIEIARGCRYKCAFCSLGWRTPVRENAGSEVVSEIIRSPRRIHLQAGDAESHSEIDSIRSALRSHGGSDLGWTGRLDSLFENPDQTIPGQKRYAFGVEGVSYRLRRAVGKAYLTDDRLVSDTVRFFESIEGDGKGRAAWHIIAGLPSETKRDAIDLLRVVQRIDQEMRGKVSRNLSLHWQPFQPLPGTPMQWCAAGRGARAMAAMLSPAERQPYARIRNVCGRTDDMALVCSILARSGRGGTRLLEALAEGRVSVENAERIAESTTGALDPDAPLPWDWIQTSTPRETLRKAYDVAMSRFSM